VKKSGPPEACRRFGRRSQPHQQQHARVIANTAAVSDRVVIDDPLVDGGWGASCPAWSTIERWEPPSHTGASSHGTAGGRART
jgi:hypothetical protein